MILMEDTRVAMESGDYRHRFIAEYAQTKIRYQKLHKMIVQYEAGTLSFKPNCPIELLQKQAAAMGQYLKILEVRAEIEKIDIDDWEIICRRLTEEREQILRNAVNETGE